ncbi:S8 family peptidase [Actinomadura sp. DC4]|uniref:S8 family peptidase n=1 Tax=Actinomadura sp. DC4 TaxID=3055069 RepID=UPI0025AF5BD8|nr:S8 family peptidase [Actinomadura sp. DC4]MDN3355939.1 S8 family peptidase [Actinomadura sp. DC4]
MRIPRRFLIACTAVACAAVPLSGALSSPKVAVSLSANNGVKGQYIVTMKHPSQVSHAIGFPTLHRFTDGFAARLSAAQLDKVRRDPGVAAIEQDQVMKISTTQVNPTWGLDRLDERVLPLSRTYGYTHTGTGVDAYVIDTGIDTTLTQFGGRADTAYGEEDCNGHGTHVAGLIGSKSYGVAKDVQLHGVQVLDCDGEGSTSDVIAGVDWVRTNHAALSVANLSLGGSKSTALNNAVTALSKSGVFVAVAAGNDNGSACATSPASAGSVEAAGASSSTDTRASFSNYGSCVDIYAPGVKIKSTYLGGTAYLDGTSMASPFVAGVAALYKSAYGQATFGTIQKWLTDHATNGVIKKNKSGTNNRLLNKSSL